MTATASIFADQELGHVLADDPELLAIADAIAQTQRRARNTKSPRRRMLLVAALLTLLLAAPAYALVRSIIEFGSKPPADGIVVKQFGYLNEAAPSGMNPAVIEGAARHVADYTLADGRKLALSIAPTKTGGFCEDWGNFAETCDATRAVPIDLGRVAGRIPQGPAFAFGSVLDPAATNVDLRWADGRTVQVPLVRVSAPINASFYFYALAVDDWPVTATATDADGQVVAISGQRHAG
jgi:hypothetical protein